MANRVDDKLISELIELTLYKNVSLFEVLSEYCDENDIEPQELLKTFDEEFILQIKKSAVDSNVSLKKFMEERKHKISLLD